jgi:hypothetical protein
MDIIDFEKKLSNTADSLNEKIILQDFTSKRHEILERRFIIQHKIIVSLIVVIILLVISSSSYVLATTVGLPDWLVKKQAAQKSNDERVSSAVEYNKEHPIILTSSDIAYTQSCLKATSEEEMNRTSFYTATGIHYVASEGISIDWTGGSLITAKYDFFNYGYAPYDMVAFGHTKSKSSQGIIFQVHFDKSHNMSTYFKEIDDTDTLQLVSINNNMFTFKTANGKTEVYDINTHDIIGDSTSSSQN